MNKSRMTLHHQMKEAWTEKIINNEWKVGDKIPTEFELCEQYQISRITVRQALKAMEDEGYLVRQAGKGTFVAIPKIEQNLMSFYSLSQEFRKRGLTPRSEVLEFHIQIADKEILQKLYTDNNQVYYIKRLRFANDVLMAIESTYLPVDLFPDLKEDDIKNKALYDMMRDSYGIIPSNADESFGATIISDKEAVYFGMKKGMAAIDIERLTLSGNRCIEYTTGVIRGDKFRFHVKLS